MRRLLMALLATCTLICGSTTIDLLDPQAGYLVRQWRPVVPGYKAGGVYQDSPLAAGRRLTYAQRDTYVEAFELEGRAGSQDAMIRATQELRRFLQLAADYWLNSEPSVQPDIPYLKAQAFHETNPRYAVITAGQLPTDDNPYGQPFFQPHCESSMSRQVLALEHGPWQADVPGGATCVQASTIQAGIFGQTTVSGSPAADNDDGFNHPAQTDMAMVQDHIFFGYDTSEKVDGFIRFTGMNIPAGATILSAYVTFISDASIDIADCKIKIYAEQTDDAASWGDAFRPYWGRWWASRNSAYVLWPPFDDGADRSVEAWIDGNGYNTPDLTPIIQPIVNRPGWVSGNDIGLFFRNDGSDTGAYRAAAAFGHASYAAPVLTVTYLTPSNYGRAATCNRENYTANHHTRAQLSHVYWNSGVNWSGNLIGAATPFDLYDNPIADADALYFGVQTSLTNSGPFSSLVFDLTTAAAYTGTATIIWQYWNGAWVTLTTRDNTADSKPCPFTVAGVNSVHWLQPSDWTTTAVNGVTGYWVRALVDLPVGGDAITTPQQGNRDIYTICWPFLDVAAAQVGGDMPALLRAIAENESDEAPARGALPALYASRQLFGLRSLSRGADFSAYLNLGGEQNATGVFVTCGTNTSFGADLLSPTGMSARYNPAGAENMLPRVYVWLDPTTIADQYNGTYHAFVRGRQANGAAGNILVRLRVYNGSTIYTSESVAFTTLATPQALDMGRLQLPGFELTADEPAGNLNIIVEASSTSGTPDLYLYDLILLPVDEWATDVSTTDLAPATDYILNGWDNYLDLDSATRPRQPHFAGIRQAATGYQNTTWRNITTGPAILQSGRAQRLWHFSMQTRNTGVVRADPEIAFRHELDATTRYYSMRGDR